MTNYPALEPPSIRAPNQMDGATQIGVHVTRVGGNWDTEKGLYLDDVLVTCRL